MQRFVNQCDLANQISSFRNRRRRTFFSMSKCVGLSDFTLSVIFYHIGSEVPSKGHADSVSKISTTVWVLTGSKIPDRSIFAAFFSVWFKKRPS